MQRLVALMVCTVMALTACQTSPGPYRVHYIPGAGAAVTIDGQLDEKGWQLAQPLTDFTDPWRGGAAPTRFLAFIDERNLYFAFDVHDTTLQYDPQWRGENTLDHEDRVEIYFALDDNLAKYFCVEIDSGGRVHDFAGSFPRKWDTSWTMPGLRTAGKTTTDGYVVEGSIPLSSLKALGVSDLGSGHAWRMGLFRADLNDADSKSVHWITWIDPHTPKPDFHCPAAFGLFQARKFKATR